MGGKERCSEREMIYRVSSKIQEAENGADAFQGSCLCVILCLSESPNAPGVWKVNVGWSLQSARPSENGSSEFQSQSLTGKISCRPCLPRRGTFRVNSPGLAEQGPSGHPDSVTLHPHPGGASLLGSQAILPHPHSLSPSPCFLPH